jgi:hypothetical protein
MNTKRCKEIGMQHGGLPCCHAAPLPTAPWLFLCSSWVPCMTIKCFPVCGNMQKLATGTGKPDADCGIPDPRLQTPDTSSTMPCLSARLKVSSLSWKSGAGLLDIRLPLPSERFDDQSTQMDAAHVAEDRLKDLKMSTCPQGDAPQPQKAAHGPWSPD